MNVTIGKKAVLLCREAGITSFMWGYHGLGKSSIHKQICRDNFWGFIDMRCSQMESSDLRGLPDKEGGLTVYRPPNDLPQGHGPDETCPACTDLDRDSEEFLQLLANTPKNAYCQGMLFLDELNRAEDDVLQAAFQLVLDREIGMYTLPSGWSVHVAGNFGGGQGMYAVNNFDDAAFLDRFCHLTLSPGSQYMSDWSKYMVTREDSDVTNKILQFVAFNEDHLAGKLEGSNEISIQPSPRAWEMVAKVEAACLRRPDLREGRKTCIQGLIGLGLVQTYEQFTCKVTPAEVINAGMRRIHKKLNELNRNEKVGLVWALGANCKKKTDELDRTQRNNVIDFLQWLSTENKERDLAVSLATNLVSMDGAERALSGALISNPELARLAKEYGLDKGGEDKSGNPWLDILSERPELQDILSALTSADDAS